MKMKDLDILIENFFNNVPKEADLTPEKLIQLVAEILEMADNKKPEKSENK